MSVEVKICGVNTAEAVNAAVGGGARYVGLNFYPPSPRAVSADVAARLAANVPERVLRVALFVDPDDDTLGQVIGRVPFELLQLHGSEPPGRIAEITARFGLPVMKVIKVATAADLARADAFLGVAERLLFDAKAPKDMKNALPGGNAVAFDWRLLAGRTWPRPWMLSGGLTPENLKQAVTTSGARAVDVSSGVEDAPGRKSPAKVAEFLEKARTL